MLMLGLWGPNLIEEENGISPLCVVQATGGSHRLRTDTSEPGEGVCGKQRLKKAQGVSTEVTLRMEAPAS